jgi:hypothetical protein
MTVKKLSILTFCLFFYSNSWAFWGSTSANDYSKDANSEYYCNDLAGTAVTTAAGLSPLNPALTLYNPYGSGKNLVLLDVGIDITAAPAAAAQFMLAYSTAAGAPTTTTPAQTTSAYINVTSTNPVTASTGLCYRAATIPSVPIAFRYLGGTTGAAAISGVVMTDLTQGKVVVPPGGTISIQSTSAAAIIAHLLWREDPI